MEMVWMLFHVDLASCLHPLSPMLLLSLFAYPY